MNFYINITLFIIEVVFDIIDTYNTLEVIDLVVKSLK